MATYQFQLDLQGQQSYTSSLSVLTPTTLSSPSAGPSSQLPTPNHPSIVPVHTPEQPTTRPQSQTQTLTPAPDGKGSPIIIHYTSSRHRGPYGSGDHDDGFNLEFSTVDEFLKWKQDEEQTNCVDFFKVDSHSSKATPPRFKEHVKLACSRHMRAGQKKYVKKHPDRQRKTPSKKIEDGGCPATISYKTYYDSPIVRVSYNNHHSHPLGAANFPFTKAYRRTKSRSQNQVQEHQANDSSPLQSDDPNHPLPPPEIKMVENIELDFQVDEGFRPLHDHEEEGHPGLQVQKPKQKRSGLHQQHHHSLHPQTQMHAQALQRPRGACSGRPHQQVGGSSLPPSPPSSMQDPDIPEVQMEYVQTQGQVHGISGIISRVPSGGYDSIGEEGTSPSMSHACTQHPPSQQSFQQQQLQDAAVQGYPPSHAQNQKQSQSQSSPNSRMGPQPGHQIHPRPRVDSLSSNQPSQSRTNPLSHPTLHQLHGKSQPQPSGQPGTTNRVQTPSHGLPQNSSTPGTSGQIPMPRLISSIGSSEGYHGFNAQQQGQGSQAHPPHGPPPPAPQRTPLSQSTHLQQQKTLPHLPPHQHRPSASNSTTPLHGPHSSYPSSASHIPNTSSSYPPLTPSNTPHLAVPSGSSRLSQANTGLDRNPLLQDRWTRIETMFSQVRSAAYSHEFQEGTVSALEMLLVKLLIEAPPTQTQTSVSTRGRAHDDSGTG